jgi:hypothetical protein
MLEGLRGTAASVKQSTPIAELSNLTYINEVSPWVLV